MLRLGDEIIQLNDQVTTPCLQAKQREEQCDFRGFTYWSLIMLCHRLSGDCGVADQVRRGLDQAVR